MNKQSTVSHLGVEITVYYDYYHFSHGKREKGTGAPLEPDDPAEVTVNEIHAGGVNITELLDEKTLDGIGEQMLNDGTAHLEAES